MIDPASAASFSEFISSSSSFEVDAAKLTGLNLELDVSAFAYEGFNASTQLGSLINLQVPVDLIYAFLQIVVLRNPRALAGEVSSNKPGSNQGLLELLDRTFLVSSVPGLAAFCDQHAIPTVEPSIVVSDEEDDSDDQPSIVASDDEDASEDEPLIVSSDDEDVSDGRRVSFRSILECQTYVVPGSDSPQKGLFCLERFFVGRPSVKLPPFMYGRTTASGLYKALVPDALLLEFGRFNEMVSQSEVATVLSSFFQLNDSASNYKSLSSLRQLSTKAWGSFSYAQFCPAGSLEGWRTFSLAVSAAYSGLYAYGTGKTPLAADVVKFHALSFSSKCYSLDMENFKSQLETEGAPLSFLTCDTCPISSIESFDSDEALVQSILNQSERYSS